MNIENFHLAAKALLQETTVADAETLGDLPREKTSFGDRKPRLVYLKQAWKVKLVLTHTFLYDFPTSFALSIHT